VVVHSSVLICVLKWYNHVTCCRRLMQLWKRTGAAETLFSC